MPINREEPRAIKIFHQVLLIIVFRNSLKTILFTCVNSRRTKVFEEPSNYSHSLGYNKSLVRRSRGYDLSRS